MVLAGSIKNRATLRACSEGFDFACLPLLRGAGLYFHRVKYCSALAQAGKNQANLANNKRKES